MDTALFQAEKMILDGADILDIGGESTRPGYIPITESEEIERTAPIIEQIKTRFDIPVSIDTYKSAVAEAALQSGANLVNDIWGFKWDSKMAEIVCKHQASCCLMHNRTESIYQNFIPDVLNDMKECIAIAKKAGIPDDKIILDPGVGFGKTYEMNLEIIRKIHQLKEIGYPLLLGTSRKSVIGLTLNLPASERVEGTLATTVYGVIQGCSFVRVHDIKENKRAIQMMEAILNK
jgi:dihydropteroate synthase